MERILSLLDQRNHYFEKFFSLNEAELGRFLDGDFDGLDRFYRTRENILKIVKYIESEIELGQKSLASDYVPTKEEKQKLRASLAAKQQYAQEILKQDLRILECIEHIKNSVIRELQEVRKAKKAANGYKTSLNTTRDMDSIGE